MDKESSTENESKNEKEKDSTEEEMEKPVDLKEESKKKKKKKKETVKISKSELEEKDKKISDLQDDMLRLRAETDNFRKRLTKDKQDSIRFANEKLVKEILPILNNLERALAAPNVSVENLMEGVQMISKQFHSLLDKENIKPIPSVGEKFDPNIHEALSQIESDEHEENTIIEEYSKGYYYNDRVLIPAKVVTAKKPQKKEKADQADDETATAPSPDAEMPN